MFKEVSKDFLKGYLFPEGIVILYIVVV